MIFFAYFSQLVYSSNTCPTCTISDDLRELISVPKNSKQITIPNTIEVIYGSDKTNNAFSSSKTTLISFSFESQSSLKTISKYAFYECTSLETIDLSQCLKLETIGDDAFFNCSSVKLIKLPTSAKLATIGTEAFSHCSFPSITIPNTVERMGKFALSDNTILTSVIFEKECNITQLEKYLITRCNSLNNITIPASVRTLSSFAEACYGLTWIDVETGNGYFESFEGVLFTEGFKSLIVFPINRYNTYEIPKNIESIGWAAFMYSKLTTLIIPNTLTTIVGWAFSSSTISNISLPDSLIKIEDSAFRNCQKITNIVIPDNVTKIGSEAFYGCTSLKEIFIPNTVTELGGGIFVYCNKELNVTFESGSLYSNINYMITNHNQTEIIYYYGDESNITIINTIETIKTSAFKSCKTIVNVKFEPESQLTTIGESAFESCPKLQTFEFPSTIERIEKNAFKNCNQLSNVSINSSHITIISSCCFQTCTSLHTLVIESDNLYIIEDSAFNGCKSLSNVQLFNNLQSLGNNCFQDCTSLSYIQIPSTVSLLGMNCFNNCGLTEVEFNGNNITSLPDKLFYKCVNLHTVDPLPSSIQKIGENAFAYTALRSFTIPSSTVTLDKYCFEGCSSLTNFTIPPQSQLQNIEYGVFSNCLSLTFINNDCDNFSVENEALFNKEQTIFYILPPNSSIRYFSLPSSLKSIRQQAFFSCHNLELIFIPENSDINIGPYAFEDCINLKSINIPRSVTIGIDAFKGCSNLFCGLLIQNRDFSYLESLVVNSSLPRRCISECINKCTSSQMSAFISPSFLFILLSAPNSF